MYAALDPEGAAYVNVMGLAGVPEPVTARAVVPSVSVKFPLESMLTWLPLRSVYVDDPEFILRGG